VEWADLGGEGELSEEWEMEEGEAEVTRKLSNACVALSATRVEHFTRSDLHRASGHATIVIVIMMCARRIGHFEQSILAKLAR
jgi:hypothetical protein